jgi:recombination protein RecR
MQTPAAPVTALIEEFAKLPGIGPKTAQRLTFFLLRSPTDQARRLADAIVRVKESIIQCSICFNLTETDPCPICSNPERDRASICVVEEPLDVLALEKTGVFKGVYHVLHGALSPLHGVGPEQLRIANLERRVQSGSVQELILATNPTLEGEATATYLSRMFKGSGIKVTRIATGVPAGSDIEYADEVTMQKAIEGRHEL